MCYADRPDIERLRAALARVLSDFPEYAGRLRVDADTLYIEQPGHGARLEVATSSETSEVLVAQDEPRCAYLLCPPMSRGRTLSGKDALFAARLTETANGSVLGLTWHHSVGDLTSTMLLIRAWSSAYRGLAYDVPPRVLDRQQYLDERMPDPPSAVSALHVCSFRELLALGPLLMRRKGRVDLRFGLDQLEQIQQWAARDGFVSTCDALFAHIVSVLSALTPKRPRTRLVLAVDYRRRVGLPGNVLGNMISIVTVNAKPERDPVTIASEVRARLTDYASQHADYHATQRFLAQHPGLFERKRMVPNVLDTSGGSMVFADCSKSGIYDIEFESMPILVTPLTPAPLPWMAQVLELPKRAGLHVAMCTPAAVADQLNSPEGRALMHTPPGAAAAE